MAKKPSPAEQAACRAAYLDSKLQKSPAKPSADTSLRDTTMEVFKAIRARLELALERIAAGQLEEGCKILSHTCQFLPEPGLEHRFNPDDDPFSDDWLYLLPFLINPKKNS